VALDGAATSYVAEASLTTVSEGDSVHRIVTTVRWQWHRGGYGGDGGPATQRDIELPLLAWRGCGAGNIYIADLHNNRIPEGCQLERAASALLDTRKWDRKAATARNL